MQWILTILILASAGGILLFLKFKPNEKRIIELEEEGKYEDAILEYEKLFENKQISNEGLWRLTNLLIETGRRKNAITKLKYMLSNNKSPENIREMDIKIQLATLLYEEKRDKEALPILIEIYKDGDYVPDILHKIGTIAYSQNDYENARKFLLKYVDIVEKDEEALYLTASALVNTDNMKQAINYLSNLAELESNKERYFYYLGVAYLRIHDFKNAKINFLKALELGAAAEKLVNSMRGLFICFLVEKNYEKAKKHFDSASSLSISASVDIEKLKEKVYIDRALLYIFIDDIDNKPFMSKELAKVIDNMNLEDDEFKNNLINSLRSEEAHSIPENPQSSNEDKELSGENLVYDNYPKTKADLLLKWCKYGFDKDFISGDVELERDDEFEIKDVFKKQLPKNEEENEDKPLKTPLIEELMGTSKQIITETARKILNKLGLQIIDEIYVDEDKNMDLGDGIDFIAEEKSAERTKYFVAFRRWNSDNIGEFSVRSIADTIKIINFTKGIFIAPGKLSNEAMAFLDQHKNIRFIGKRQLEKLLQKVDFQKIKNN